MPPPLRPLNSHTPQDTLKSPPPWPKDRNTPTRALTPVTHDFQDTWDNWEEQSVTNIEIPCQSPFPILRRLSLLTLQSKAHNVFDSWSIFIWMHFLLREILDFAEMYISCVLDSISNSSIFSIYFERTRQQHLRFPISNFCGDSVSVPLSCCCCCLNSECQSCFEMQNQLMQRALFRAINGRLGE